MPSPVSTRASTTRLTASAAPPTGTLATTCPAATAMPAGSTARQRLSTTTPTTRTRGAQPRVRNSASRPTTPSQTRCVAGRNRKLICLPPDRSPAHHDHRNPSPISANGPAAEASSATERLYAVALRPNALSATWGIKRRSNPASCVRYLADSVASVGASGNNRLHGVTARHVEDVPRGNLRMLRAEFVALPEFDRAHRTGDGASNGGWTRSYKRAPSRIRACDTGVWNAA